MSGHAGDRAPYFALATRVAHEAGLTLEQTRGLRSAAGSWAMENMPPTEHELRLAADITTGRITSNQARRPLGV